MSGPSCQDAAPLRADADPATPEPEEEIPVVICAAAGRMGAAMAAINSIYSNTDANVLFYVVGLRNSLSRIRENLYSSSLGGGVATSPMLIVFHGKHSTINPLWHIRHLGWTPDTRFSEHFLQEAKLLLCNGRHKPWGFPSVHNDLWESWFVPDPAGIFQLRHSS